MIKLVGIKEIDEVIKKLPSQLDHKLLQSIHAEALKPFVRAAYFQAPLKSGRTAESIGTIKPGIKRSGSIGLVISGPRRGRFGGNVAHLSEFGTKQRRNSRGANRGSMPRRPFIQPSWERTRTQVEANIATATGRVIYNFMKRTIKKYG
jgi:hypothetical protein